MRTDNYKGFEIVVERYKSVIDNEMLRWAVVRNSDGYIMHEGIDYAEVFVEENQKNAIVLQEFKHWKERVDKWLSLPIDKQVEGNF